MKPSDIIVICIIVCIIGLAILYIVKSKKKGQKCIGCPYSKTCSKNNCENENKQI